MSSEKFNPLKWREFAAVAHMHVDMARIKLQALKAKDPRDFDQALVQIGKSVECIEAAHEAAINAYNEFAILARRAKSVRGVRLTSVKQQGKIVAFTVPIAELKSS